MAESNFVLIEYSSVRAHSHNAYNCIEPLASCNCSIEEFDVVGRNEVNDFARFPEFRRARQHARGEKSPKLVGLLFSFTHEFVNFIEQYHRMVNFHEPAEDSICGLLHIR
jgi:hypothetical protein